MERKGSAEWMGDIKDGKGSVSTESGILNKAPYSFKTRFGEDPGTNPEELIAAAQAGCFSMALSIQLGKAGLKPEVIKTTATVSLVKSTEGASIPAIHLEVTAKVPNINQETFKKIATEAKEGCPVSKLMNAKITMDATLEI